jgi:hypothetical protein
MLALRNSELAADITGEQQSLGTNRCVEAAKGIWMMTLDVAGYSLGRAPMLGLELDLLAASTGTERCHCLQSVGPTGSCFGPGTPESNDFNWLQHRRRGGFSGAYVPR